MRRHDGAATIGPPVDGMAYQPGLDRIDEAIISSHFMAKLAAEEGLELYGEDEFGDRALDLTGERLRQVLLPGLLAASSRFAEARARAASVRARANFRKYGLDSPARVGTAQIITEVMFDPEFVRGSRELCSREWVCRRISERVREEEPIDLAIPALPFKFSSPLKTRGGLPDLAEVNFILELYEIVASIELLYRQARPHLEGRLARFTVISDGSRFREVVHEPAETIDRYLAHLRLWIARLGLEECITILDYCSLLHENLPAEIRRAKAALFARARREYVETLSPLFDPDDMTRTFRAAARTEPDPESSSSDGRFVPLLRSLVYTVNYQALQGRESLGFAAYRRLYRELTAHLFEPYDLGPAAEGNDPQPSPDGAGSLPEWSRELLRIRMLQEVWDSAIDYIAEIKSARDLREDPISTCLPAHLRWTIHPKPGQLALRTATASGTSVLAWAGTAAFKPTRQRKVKLCTLPVLALEGIGALPVRSTSGEPPFALGDQPLFYICPGAAAGDLDQLLDNLLDDLKSPLDRRRAG
jgi:hypothetical protein